ncbi:NUDIX hydrolase [Plantibacter sp. Mn2098]|uniref:NUDIX hydrolase n=1 Tax=Plantibacter sp. Mn2098 TaxID=3395266 RepID=UPI003BD0B01D
MLPETALADVASYRPRDADDATLLQHYLSQITEHGPASLDRSRSEHLTASAFVLDDDLTRTLLCYHRKGDFWVQPGGHLDETDESLHSAALRELGEETGITRFVAQSQRPADIDRHALGDGFGACSWHLDVGFIVIADPTELTTLSDESLQLAWWPLDALPDGVAPGFGRRIANIALAAAAQLGEDHNA